MPSLDSDDLDATFFALSSDLRRRMLDLLKSEPGCNVNRVGEVFADEVGRFAVMKHLATLERGGLIVTQREGREKRLWFDPTPIQFIHERWTTEFSAFWAAKLTRLKLDAEGAEVKRLPVTPHPAKDEGTADMADSEERQDDNGGPSADAVFRIFIKADIGRIWRELTKTGEPQGAIFNAWLHTEAAKGLAPGGRMQMRTGSGRHVIVDGQVLECRPPHRFVHTHRFTQYDDPVCRVAYDLKPVGEGVEVTLTVIGLPANTKTGKSMASGGHAILKSLKAIAETGRPALGTRAMYWLFDRLEFVLPARTKSELWPIEKRS